MAKIVIVGAGMMGSAMCFPASDNGHQIVLVGTPYDREVISRIQTDNHHPRLNLDMPAHVSALQFEDLDKALEGSDLLVSGVPSFGIDWFSDNVLARVPDDTVVLSLTKGLEVDDAGGIMPISQAYQKREKEVRGRTLSINAIGGPCISLELCRRLHTSVALCGSCSDTLHWIASLLRTPYYHINPTSDVIGIECAVALKNAYAVGVALAIGMAEQDGATLSNPQAALFGQAVREMLRITHMMGGQTESVIYATSDLYVTINAGRNRMLGELLGKGKTFVEAMKELSGVTLESISVITRVAQAMRIRHKMRTANINRLPLLRHLDEIINGGAPMDIPWNEFG